MRVKKDIPAPSISRPIVPPKVETQPPPKTTPMNVRMGFDARPAPLPSKTAANRVLQTKQVGELSMTKVDWSDPFATFDRLGGDGAASLVGGLVASGKDGFGSAVDALMEQGAKLLGQVTGGIKDKLESALDGLGVAKGQNPTTMNMLDLSKVQGAVAALNTAGANALPGMDALKLGASGDAVRSLQGLINHAMPGLSLQPDGKFGQLTQDALRVFQGQNGLPVTGAMSPDTTKKLQEVAAHFAERLPASHGEYVPDAALDPVRDGTATLGLGQTNPAVEALHTALNHTLPGALGLPPSSSFTDMTESAVRLFQNATGLPVNGEVTRPVAELLDAGAGKANWDARKAEAAVRGNKAREKAVSIDDIKKDPDAFLKNVVQVDGMDQTGLDISSCGPTAMLMGMIAGRPESMVELGKKLMDDQGNITPEGQKLLGAADSPMLKAAVKNIRDGKFSAKDVTVLAECMREKMGTPTGGVKPDDLIALRAAISKMGVSVPRMELQQFGPPDGSMGHWRVGVNGKQYNPWPNAQGQSSVRTGADSLIDGCSDWPGGQMRDKIYIDDKTVSHNVYTVYRTAAPPYSTNQDPPLFVAGYELQPDGSMKRTSVSQEGFLKQAPGGAGNQLNNVVPESIASRI